MWMDEMKNQEENIKNSWENDLKIAKEQRTLGQRLHKLETSLEKTGGFNKFSLTCPYCTKNDFFDAKDNKIKINPKISKALRNDIPPEYRIENEQRKHIILYYFTSYFT